MHDVGKGEKGDVPHRVGSVIEGVPYTFQGLKEAYLIFVNFGTPPHYLGLYKVHQKVCKFATK